MSAISSDGFPGGYETLRTAHAFRLGPPRGFARLLGDTDGRNCLLSEAYGREAASRPFRLPLLPVRPFRLGLCWATVIAREFGWRSAWYPVGAYAFAAGIAIERIAVRRHLALDVAAGALTGVAMTELGYFLADRIYGGRGLSEKYRLSVSPAALQVPAGCAGQGRDAIAVAPGVIFSLEF